jgi:predicted amidophosphoribosyltransferase
MMADAMNTKSAAPQTSTCMHCHTSMPENGKFCPSCGKAQSSNNCISCNVPLAKGSKFCSSCGTKQEKSCPNCNQPVAGAFCASCGTKVD